MWHAIKVSFKNRSTFRTKKEYNRKHNKKTEEGTLQFTPNLKNLGGK